MASRKAIANELSEWVGADGIELVNPASGWPAHFRARTLSDWVSVDAYLGPIGHSQRGRQEIERRFQNPGKNRPITPTPDAVSVLIGLYESDGTRLLVGMDAERRIGRSTRQSLFMPLHLLRSGGAWGWAEHFSDSGERLIAFRPELLPIYIELKRSCVDAAAEDIEQLVVAAGANDAELGAEAVTRALDAAKRVVRRGLFSRRVKTAYGGHCAMCGLDSSLVDAAYIYPLTASGCEDEVWNGLALCRNHLAAFDSCMVHVDPKSGRIRLHPELMARARVVPGCRAFTGATFPVIETPRSKDLRPRAEMFEKRYRFLKPKYSWA
jgi:hypothetical protein